MAITQSYSSDELSDLKLTVMFERDKRTRSNFLTWLINKEWELREELGVVSVEELPHPEGATPVPLVTVKKG